MVDIIIRTQLFGELHDRSFTTIFMQPDLLKKIGQCMDGPYRKNVVWHQLLHFGYAKGSSKWQHKWRCES